MEFDDKDFIAEIHAQSHDETPRLVYADWLEDQDDPRAEYLRLECDLIGLKPGDALFEELYPRLMQLRTKMPEEWLAEIGRSRVVNCNNLHCPRLWKRLKMTSANAIRICETCRKAVQYSATLSVAVEKDLSGQLVAIDNQFSTTQFEDERRRHATQ